MKVTPAVIAVLLAVVCVAAGPTSAQTTLVEEHWPNGQLRLRKHVLVQEDGTPVDHGRFQRWYDNGEKEYEAVFVLGEKEGTTVRFHRNGRKATQQEYVKGLRHGPSVSWNPSGIKVKEENWAEGKPHGTWTIWKNGEVKWRHTYKHGVPAALPEQPVSN
jgi:antitoxin component YwqK of YwqJK toxin-antitoxin module